MSSTVKNKLIWSLIVVAIVAALWTNTFVVQHASVYLRVAAWIILGLVLVGLSFLTTQGKATLSFSKEAREELQKVHWPTRQETTQITLMVMAVVLIVAIFLWGVDALFMWAVNELTDQRG